MDSDFKRHNLIPFNSYLESAKMSVLFQNAAETVKPCG